MTNVTIKTDKYPALFGGIGFHNNEAMLYPLIEKDHFEQLLCKCYREIAPGFMRTFGGYDDWSQQSMDAFAEYYGKMQKVTDTPIYMAGAMAKMHFNDEDRKLYCERVADNLLYLKREKGVGHLRYFCFSNELSCGTHAALKDDLPTLKKYHEYLYAAFQRRKLDIGLLAPDASSYRLWPTADWVMENMPGITEDISLHIYERDHDLYDLDLYGFFYEKCKEVCEKTIRCHGKRFMLTEFGIQQGSTGKQLTFPNGMIADTCRYCEDDFERAYCALMISEMIFAAINAGVAAMAYWTFTDYPDPYSCAWSEKEGYAKKWASCERFVSGTTDSKYNKWGLFKWEDSGDHSIRELYWCLAPLMKLFKRNSKVLRIESGDAMLRSCGVLNRDGSVSIGIVNRNKHDAEITLDSQLFSQGIRVYEYDPRNVPVNPFGDIQPYSAVLSPERAAYTLKAESVTFFTTDYAEKTAPVCAENLSLTDRVLSWSPVSDPEHCYYRVYASDTPDFVPGAANQIASTVGTEITVTDHRKCFKVLSVDHSGNV